MTGALKVNADYVLALEINAVAYAVVDRWTEPPTHKLHLTKAVMAIKLSPNVVT